MKVSVTTPIYNKSKYLEPSIRSISQQDYNDIEFVLVEDGSTDDSNRILSDFEKGERFTKEITKQRAKSFLPFKNPSPKQCVDQYHTDRKLGCQVRAIIECRIEKGIHPLGSKLGKEDNPREKMRDESSRYSYSDTDDGTALEQTG